MTPCPPWTPTTWGDAAQQAAADGYGALLVEVDAPGGQVISMREIVQWFLDAAVQVILYVTSSGAWRAPCGRRSPSRTR